MSPSPRLVIGTRGSPLALAQASQTRDLLLARHPDLDPDQTGIRVIRTTGDRILDRALAEVGGKGLFTKEIEEGLLAGEVNIAVHSMKDMPTVLPDGLVITCLLPREDPRDAFLSPRAGSLAALPAGAVVGSSSLRRQAQILRARPDLKVITFRGNVQTRLRKLDEGQADATFLALAGLRRLGMAEVATAVVPTDEMLPAVAQGAIGIEHRAGDARAAGLLAPLNDDATATCVACERAFLAVLDGSCRTPIAGHAVLDGKGGLDFRGLILTPDGRTWYETTRHGPATDGQAMGRDAGTELRGRAGPGFFAT